jgi:signal transduction histidine kinase
MRAASRGERSVRATSSHGPQELRIMGSVFNAMQEQAASYEETLKLQVQQRTQQLELARAQAVDAAHYKTQFMAHVSHDMRMPLVVIKDLAQAAVRESAFGADKHLMEESLARIVHRTDALMKQIELVLQFMRSEEAMTVATPSQVLTLQQFFHTRRRDLELLAQRNGNVVVWNIKASDALVEEEAFATILENLIDNAAKFTEKGRIDIAIELEERCLVAKITDSGCGIAAEALPFVWDDFRRATAGAPGSATQGFGLGLAIVRRLVDRVGGEREIVSTPSHGTQVVIRLPRLSSMQPTLQSGIAEEHKVQGVHAQMREDRALQSTGEMIDQRVAEARDTRQGNIEEAARQVRHTE